MLETKPGTDPQLVMAYLYKHTALQDTFPVNLTCLVPVGNHRNEEIVRPRRLGLKEARATSSTSVWRRCGGAFSSSWSNCAGAFTSSKASA
ncbi:MAG: hypothetical protein U0736_04360 [Gemmataceae bacterium]